MVKVTLDDNTYIVTAEEHPFVLRNGSKKRADELKENDSLMPFYRGKKQISKHKDSNYETIFNPNTSKYELTHRLIANDSFKNQKNTLTESLVKDYLIVHHKDFNKTNNSPTNLEWMKNLEHISYHIIFG
jgi:hypothetical protein